MKTTKYNVGDKVRIVSKWAKNASVNGNGKMDKWLGKVMTIRGIIPFGSLNAYLMEEDCKENFGAGWAWSEDEIAGLATSCNQKIVITSDGEETLARLYDGNKVVKTATAKCSSKDVFNFEEGAKIAYDRLMRKYKEGDKVKVTGNTCHHYANIGDVITLERESKYSPLGTKAWYFKEKCGYIIEGDFVLANASDDKKKDDKKKDESKKKFVPHIVDDTLGEKIQYGNLGDPTNYKDAVGRSLVVGDTVELFCEGKSIGEKSVVCEKIGGARREKIFVMGIEIDCDDERGTICNDWKIIKKRSFEEVKDGEIVSGVKYIKTNS